jgi:ligand-binding sensor domain-containing protein
MKNSFLLSLLLLSILFSCKDDDGNIAPNLDNQAVSALTFDNEDVLWVATDSGLFKQVTDGFQWIDVAIDAPVTSLAVEKTSNSLWVGTTNGISKIDLSSKDYTATPIAVTQLSNPSIVSAHIDSASNIWFGTALGFTMNSGDKWKANKFKKSLAGNIVGLDFEKFGINSIASWDGDYFFATNGNKVWRAFQWDASVDAFSGATMLDFPYNGQAIADTMYVVFIDSKGQQWHGGVKGLQVHIGHDSKTDFYSFYDELANPVVRCVAESNDGKIWVGTENGISIFDGTNWTTSSATLPSNFVTSIVFDKNNKAFIGTKKGLATIN